MTRPSPFHRSRPPAILLGLAGWALAAQTVTAPIGTIISEQSRTAFSMQGAGARAMGLGGAFIALADDATAVSFNPAGLAQMVKPEISFVGRGLRRGVAFQDAQTVAGSRVLLVDDSLISNSRFDPLLLAGTVPLRIGGQRDRQRCFAVLRFQPGRAARVCAEPKFGLWVSGRHRSARDPTSATRRRPRLCQPARA